MGDWHDVKIGFSLKAGKFVKPEVGQQAESFGLSDSLTFPTTKTIFAKNGTVQPNP
jgi:hypothetical protein